MSIDNEDVIIAAVEDSITPEDTSSDSPDPVEASPDAPVEASADPVETTEPDPTHDPVEGVVASPAAKAQALAGAPEQDDFEKKYGIPKESAPGRENRIPYSRVTKIVSKAVKDAESTFTPRIQEFETKVKAYETELSQAKELAQRVSNFENVMMNDKPRFLALLRDQLGYAELLAPQAAPAVADTPAPQGDDMPQPDQELSDGSRVYSMDGLRDLNAWNRAQARKEVLAEVEKTYGPIAKDYENSARERAALKYQREVLEPAVNAQIQEAYTWPLFKENEEAITKALNDNPKFNLERAYQAVVLPKLQANRDDIRKQVIADLKKAPVSTSAPSGGTKPNSTAIKTGPRDLEEVIREAAANLPR